MSGKNSTHLSWATAITFAEAGEWETARSFMPSIRQSKAAAWFQDLCMAVTFAEHGLHDEALRLLSAGSGAAAPSRKVNFLELCALDNVRCTFATLSPVKLGIN